MAAIQYLADTSVFGRLTQPAVSAAFAPLAVAGAVSLCSPVKFELGFSARSATDHAAVMERLEAFAHVPVTDADHRRSLEVQHMLATKGSHRALSLVDALVAAVAEARGLTVLHYDADFDTVAAATGQDHRWIVPRGTAD